MTVELAVPARVTVVEDVVNVTDCNVFVAVIDAALVILELVTA